MECHTPCQGGMKSGGVGGASASLASSDQIIHLAPTCQKGIYHIPSTSSISLYPSFSVLSFRSLLSFFSLLTPHPFRFLWYVVLTSKWQRILILAELSAQSAGIKPGLRSRFVPLRKRGEKWEKEKTEPEKDTETVGGRVDWRWCLIWEEKKVTKQCPSSLTKVKTHNHDLIAQFARYY